MSKLSHLLEWCTRSPGHAVWETSVNVTVIGGSGDKKVVKDGCGVAAVLT